MKKINQSGRSLIEMLCVLAIMGILTVVTLSGYQHMIVKHRANKTVDLISQMIAMIQQNYAQQENYKGLNNTVMNSLKLLPGDFGDKADSKGILANPYDGFFSVTASDYEDNSAGTHTEGVYSTVVIELGMISKEMCIHLATTNWGIATKEGMVAVSVSSQSSKLNGSDANPGSPDEDVTIAYSNAGKAAMKAYANTTSETAVNTSNVKTAYANASKTKYKLPMSPALAGEGCNCKTEDGAETNTCSFALKFY